MMESRKVILVVEEDDAQHSDFRVVFLGLFMIFPAPGSGSTG